MEGLIVALASLIVVLLHLSLLSRVSSHAHATQKKLDETNRLLASIATRP